MHTMRVIEHGRGNAGHHIRGARPGRGDGHTDAPGSARVAVGHVRGALFMADENVLDLRVEQRIVSRQDRAARIAEDDIDAFGNQTLDNDLCSRKFFHSPILGRFTCG